MTRKNQVGRRYRLLANNERFGLKVGDVLVCRPFWSDPGHSLNPSGKLTVLHREDDQFEPDHCDIPWSQLEELKRT